MSTAAILTLIATYGPSIVPLIQQCITWIEAGKTTVTAADLQILSDFANKTSADFLKGTGIQIVDGKVVPATAAK